MLATHERAEICRSTQELRARTRDVLLATCSADQVDAAAMRQWRRVIYRAKTLPAHNLRGAHLPDAWSRVERPANDARQLDSTTARSTSRMSFWQASCAVMSLLWVNNNRVSDFGAAAMAWSPSACLRGPERERLCSSSCVHRWDRSHQRQRRLRRCARPSAAQTSTSACAAVPTRPDVGHECLKRVTTAPVAAFCTGRITARNA